MHTEISLHELELAILDALKPLPLKLNERAVDFLIKKKHLPEATVLGCLKHYYQEHPDELKGCRPIPKSALQQLISLAAQGSLPAVAEVPWWEQMVEADDGIIGPNPFGMFALSREGTAGELELEPSAAGQNGTPRGRQPGMPLSPVGEVQEKPADGSAEPAVLMGGNGEPAKPPATATPTPNLSGRRVRIGGLQARPELNGRCGVAGRFDAAKGRYEVAVEGEAEAVLLKPENLQEALEPALS